MAIILAAVTDGDGTNVPAGSDPAHTQVGARRIFGQWLGGAHLSPFSVFVPGGYFKMGTYNIGLVPGPVDSTLTDVVTPEGSVGGAAPAGDAKALTAGDVTYISPTTLQVRCFLDFAEGNGAGSVTYYEIGIFTADDRMIAYGTFQGQTKNAGLQLTNDVQIVF